MGLFSRSKRSHTISSFRIIPPQDGGWSLSPVESMLNGVRNYSDTVALEIYSLGGSVSYSIRTLHGDSLSGVMHSYFPQADLAVRRSSMDDPDVDDWMYVQEDERAVVQTLSLARDAYLPLRISDDRAIEGARRDPLAGVIGLLSGATRGGGVQATDRFGIRLLIRPAAEDWSAPWQSRMQIRRDGEDRAARVPASADTGPSMSVVLFVGCLLGLGLGNWMLWNGGDMAKLVLFNLLSLAAGGVGLLLWSRFSGRRGRQYMDEELVEAKLKSLAFWSEVQLVRIYENLGDRDEVDDNMDRILDTLKAFDDPAGNSWRAGPRREYLGSDILQYKYARHPFVGGGCILDWVDPKRAMKTALSAREVASVWHLPLGDDEMAPMERTAVRVRTPYLADLSIQGEDSGPMVGKTVGAGHDIYLPESSLRKHTIILGKSGVGKSTMIKHVVAHKLDRKSKGLDEGAMVVIDPHADLVRDILKLVPSNIADRVRLLDFGREDRVPGINLVDPKLFPDRDRCVDTIINTVKHLWDHWGGRLEDLLKNSLMAIYEFNTHPETARDEMLTMLDILALLDEGESVGQGRDARSSLSAFQRHVLGRVRDPRLREWFNAYINWPRDTRAEAVGPVHSRVGAYAKDQRASVIMGQRESTIMLSDVLTEGLVLLVSTAQGTVGRGPAALMGGTMVSLMESALRDQESIEPSKRAKCLLVCDEFQTITGADWEGMLAEIRKYGCSLMLSTQSLARLDTPERRLKAGVLGNVGCMVGYQMSAEDARIMSAEMDSEWVEERDLVNLHPHYCMVRINSDSKCYQAFSMKTLPPPDVLRGSEDSESAVLDASRSYTVDWAEAREKMNEEVAARLSGNKVDVGHGGAPDSSGDAPSGSPASGPPPSAPRSGGVYDQVMGEQERAASARPRSGGSRGDPKVTDGRGLDGIKASEIEDSKFSRELLELLANEANRDPALRQVLDKRLEGHLKYHVRRVREQETGRLRESLKEELAEGFHRLEKVTRDVEGEMEKAREEVREDERERIRAEVMAEMTGNLAPGESRDVERLRRPAGRD